MGAYSREEWILGYGDLSWDEIASRINQDLGRREARRKRELSNRVACIFNRMKAQAVEMRRQARRPQSVAKPMVVFIVSHRGANPQKGKMNKPYTRVRAGCR